MPTLSTATSRAEPGPLRSSVASCCGYELPPPSPSSPPAVIESPKATTVRIARGAQTSTPVTKALTGTRCTSGSRAAATALPFDIQVALLGCRCTVDSGVERS